MLLVATIILLLAADVGRAAVWPQLAFDLTAETPVRRMSISALPQPCCSRMLLVATIVLLLAADVGHAAVWSQLAFDLTAETPVRGIADAGTCRLVCKDRGFPL